MTESQIPSRSFLIFGIVSTVIGFFYWHYFSSTVPLMQADSQGYILFNANRTVGYPLFLWSIKQLFGNYTYLPAIQLSLHFMTATFLSLTFYQLTRRWLLGVGLLLFLVGNKEWILFDFMILTESISSSFLLLMLSFLIRFYQWEKTKDLIFLSFAAGFLILLRPVCYALIPAIGSIVYLAWPKIKTRLWALIIPLILVMLTGIGVQKYRNGFWGTESFLGHNLLGKAAILVNKNIFSKYPEDIEHLSTMAEPIQKALENLPGWQMQYILSTPYYDYLRYAYASHSYAKRFPKAYVPPRVVDQYWKEISLDIIKARPELYIQDVLVNYFALWFLWDFKTSDETKLLETLIKERSPFPVYKDFPLPPRTTEVAKKWRLIAPIVRGSLILSFISSFFLLGYVMYLRFHRRPIDTMLKIAFTGALIAHALYALTALLQAGLARYSFFAWPSIGVMMLSIIDFLWKKYRNDHT